MAKKILLSIIAAVKIGDADHEIGTPFETEDRELADKLIKEGFAVEGKPPAPAKDEANVKVRLLRDHEPEPGTKWRCNSVQSLPKAVAKAMVADGAADDSAGAVKYAESVAREEAAAARKVERK